MSWWISVASANSYLPIQGTSFAADYDALYNFTLWVSIFFFVLLMGATVFFIYKYRRRSDNDKTPHITHNYALEFLWSFIPLVLMLGVAGWGFFVWKHARTMPSDAYEVNVEAKQWMWTARYTNGKTAVNELYVPAGRKVILNLSSVDVIHSFFIPSFRIKQDVIPGHRTRLWFESDRIGDYQVFCSQYCGTAHSQMLAKIHVVSPSEFEKWLNTDSSAGMSLADLGRELYTTKGCVACHSLDGTAKVGPTWKGVWGRTEKFADGSSGKVDGEYIKESILKPVAKVVQGYPPSMPSYQGNMTDAEIDQLIEFMKTLK